mmetsp:Transcript_9037/g.21568  ORF Transcript_9037/g.21568 Transcript_9037/m.21568 type:complete len:352 (+) Transcript_9037:156-1211(+)
MHYRRTRSTQPFSPRFTNGLRGYHSRWAPVGGEIDDALLERLHHVGNNLVLQAVPHWHVIPRLGLKIHVQNHVDVGVRLGGVLGELPVVDQHVAVGKASWCSRRHAASILTSGIGSVHHHVVVNLIPQSPHNGRLNTETHDAIVVGLADVADVAAEIAPWHPLGIRREVRYRFKSSRQRALDLVALMQRPSELVLGCALRKIVLHLEEIWDPSVGGRGCRLLLSPVDLVGGFSKKILLGLVTVTGIVLHHIAWGVLRGWQHSLVHQIFWSLQADWNRQCAQNIVSHCGSHLQGRHHLRTGEQRCCKLNGSRRSELLNLLGILCERGIHHGVVGESPSGRPHGLLDSASCHD